MASHGSGVRWSHGFTALTLAGALAAPAAAADVDIAALRAALAGRLERHGVAGYGLAIVGRDGPLYVGGGGLARREGQRPAGPDTVWRVGSVTKVFTGIATQIAARRYGFALDAPLREVVPDAPFENRWEATDPVRIGQLLEHTAGLQDLSKREFDSSDPAPLTLDQAFAVSPPSRNAQWPPGRYSSYSNTGAGLAALVIERTSGRAYEAFVRDEILTPLGMRRAGFALDDATREHLAAGYDRDGVTPIPYWHVLYRAFGGLNATAGDMARFVHWLIAPAGTSVLTPAEVTRLETPRTTLAARDGLAYGYALGLYHYVHDGVSWMGHGGDADGYLARIGYVRGLGVGYFLVINAFNETAIGAMQEIVESALTQGVPRAAMPPVAALSPAALEGLTGCYATVTRRFLWAEDADDPVLAVEVEGDHLVTVTPGGRRRPYFPVTARHFRKAGEPVATSAFVPDADGELVFLGDMGNLKRISRGTQRPCQIR